MGETRFKGSVGDYADALLKRNAHGDWDKAITQLEESRAISTECRLNNPW